MKILLADDHKLFREGIQLMLSGYDEYDIIGHASNGVQVVNFVKSNEIDLIIMDIEMPVMNGLETIRKLRKNKSKILILVLSMHNSGQFIKNALRAGANGFLPKDAGQPKLVRALNSLEKDGEYLDEDITRLIMQNLFTRKKSTDISPRELEVIKLISDQWTTKEIAEKMQLSRHTIESHRQNVMLKLGVKNTAGLVRYALEKGLIE